MLIGLLICGSHIGLEQVLASMMPLLSLKLTILSSLFNTLAKCLEDKYIPAG